MSARRIIVRPGRCRQVAGWQVYEGEGVCPLFVRQDEAVGYARQRAIEGIAEIELHDGAGALVATLPKKAEATR